MFNEVRATGEEFLEFFNTGSSAVNLNGFRLTDGAPGAPRLDRALTFDETAVVQPGGSVRDEEVIAAANERGLAMVFTGVRHFRH